MPVELRRRWRRRGRGTGRGSRTTSAAGSCPHLLFRRAPTHCRRSRRRSSTRQMRRGARAIATSAEVSGVWLRSNRSASSCDSCASPARAVVSPSRMARTASTTRASSLTNCVSRAARLRVRHGRVPTQQPVQPLHGAGGRRQRRAQRGRRGLVRVPDVEQRPDREGEIVVRLARLAGLPRGHAARRNHESPVIRHADVGDVHRRHERPRRGVSALPQTMAT